jgi:hypothetical protein
MPDDVDRSFEALLDMLVAGVRELARSLSGFRVFIDSGGRSA